MPPANVSRLDDVGRAATLTTSPERHQSEGRLIMVSAPPVRRRIVGRALRRYRESLGYTLDDAARTLECDRSKISLRHEAQCRIARRAGRDERRCLWV